MYSVLERKTGVGVRARTIPNLQQNLMNVQTNIVRKRNSIPNEKTDPLMEVKVKPSINEQLYDSKYRVAQIIRKDLDNEDKHRLHDLAKQFDRIEQVEMFNRLKNEEQLPGRSIYKLSKETDDIQTKDDAERVLRKVNGLLHKVQNSKDKSTLRQLNEFKKIAESKKNKLSIQTPRSWYSRVPGLSNTYDDTTRTQRVNTMKNPVKVLHDLRKETQDIETKDDAERVLRKVNGLLHKLQNSKDKSTLHELHEFKKIAESKISKLSPKPWYRRFYFGDENLNDVFEDYNKYKNQKSRHLSFGAVNRINELRQKIKSIIKKTNNTKFIKRLKNMNRRLKQKLLKRQRLLQQ